LFTKIKKGVYLHPRNVSKEAADLIREMLNVDPTKRISAFNATQHPWFKTKTDEAASTVFDPEVLKRLQAF